MIHSATKTGIQKPVKGYNGVYIIEIDSFGKKAVKEEAQMIQQNFGMRNMQKTSQLRLPLQILKDKAKIKKQKVKKKSNKLHKKP